MGNMGVTDWRFMRFPIRPQAHVAVTAEQAAVKSSPNIFLVTSS
jgi:hypothetical protein